MAAVNLQRIDDTLRRMWAFSIAMDSATHQSTSYIYLRVRVCLPHCKSVENFHLMALPMHDRHTGAVMYEMVVKFLDIVDPDWLVQLLSISSDGARNMTGSRKGIVTRMCKAALEWVYWIWCRAHQLDILLQNVLSDVLKDSFYLKITGFISHLVLQQKLVAYMGTTCPNPVNRWISSHKVFKWFKLHRPKLLGYIERKHPDSSPPAVWWCYLLAMQSFTSHSANTFHSIQGMTNMIYQQVARLPQLVQTYVANIRGAGPLTEAHIAELSDDQYVKVGAFAISHQNVLKFVLGLASWVKGTVDALEDEHRRILTVDISTVYMTVCDRIRRIVVVINLEHGPETDPKKLLPSVLPNELVKILPARFLIIARIMASQLEQKYSPLQIDAIGYRHKALVQTYRQEPLVKGAIDGCNADVLFSDAWDPLAQRYLDLEDYCGGVATVFPETSTVEADFSVLRWEDRSNRKLLSDFGLEGVMQSK